MLLYIVYRLFCQRFRYFFFILYYIRVVKVAFFLSLSLILYRTLALLLSHSIVCIFLRCIIHVSFHFASMDVRPFYASMQYLLQLMACCLFAWWLSGDDATAAAAAALAAFLSVCVFFSHSVFIRHDIYKFHICGHIFIHAYVIKSHRICAESLWKYPNTTIYVYM